MATLCTYNTVIFDPRTLFTRGLEITPVHSTDGRTITHSVYRITIESKVYDPSMANTTDAQMTTLRDKLLVQGGEFHYEYAGVGKLAVNVPNATAVAGARNPQFDVCWGPKPRLLSFKPIGAAKAAEVVWSVEVAIPDGPNASFLAGSGILEFNYKVGYAIDRSGLQKITHSGFLRIPQTRTSVGSRFLTKDADDYRESINPTVPQGFRRIPGEFRLSDDKCRLDFSIMDEQLPSTNILPENVINVEASHTVQTTKPGGFNWSGTLTANYELAKGADAAIAYNAFIQLVAQRIKNTIENADMKDNPAAGIPNRVARAVGGRLRNDVRDLQRDVRRFFGDPFGAGIPAAEVDPGEPAPAAKITTVIPVHWSFGEPSIYGKRSVSCSFTYTFVCDIQKIFAASALWTPVPKTEYRQWAASMQKLGVFSNRGLRNGEQQQFNLTGDIIVDLGEPMNPPAATRMG